MTSATVCSSISTAGKSSARASLTAAFAKRSRLAALFSGTRRASLSGRVTYDLAPCLLRVAHVVTAGHDGNADGHMRGRSSAVAVGPIATARAPEACRSDVEQRRGHREVGTSIDAAKCSWQGSALVRRRGRPTPPEASGTWRHALSPACPAHGSQSVGPDPRSDRHRAPSRRAHHRHAAHERGGPCVKRVSKSSGSTRMARVAGARSRPEPHQRDRARGLPALNARPPERRWRSGPSSGSSRCTSSCDRGREHRVSPTASCPA